MSRGSDLAAILLVVLTLCAFGFLLATSPHALTGSVERLILGYESMPR